MLGNQDASGFSFHCPYHLSEGLVKVYVQPIAILIGIKAEQGNHLTGKVEAVSTSDADIDFPLTWMDSP